MVRSMMILIIRRITILLLVLRPMLGAEDDLAKDTADELLEFEIKLAEIMRPKVERQQNIIQLYETRSKIKDLFVSSVNIF